MLASVGLPGTSGFVGEFLALVGAFRVNTWVAFFATTGMILSAAYMLYLYRRVAFGDQKHADAAAMPDLDWREWAMMAPIAAAVLWMGVYPESFLAPMRQDIAALDARIARAKPEGDSRIRPGQPAAAVQVSTTAHEGAH
jgi:NADH-quinone oxidoreductase subunit M